MTAAGVRLVRMTSESHGDPLGNLESLMEIITRAHAVIYAEHRRLVDLDLADETTRELLDESVRIVFERAPEAAREARSVAHEQAMQQLLDPASGPGDPPALERATGRAEDLLQSLLRRQEEIARELRARSEHAED